MLDISFLRSVSLFSELKDGDLKKIANILAKKTFKRNVTILIEEDSGSTMFIILKGSVKITRITEEEIELAEIVSDGGGGWRERRASPRLGPAPRQR